MQGYKEVSDISCQYVSFDRNIYNFVIIIIDLLHTIIFSKRIDNRNFMANLRCVVKNLFLERLVSYWYTIMSLYVLIVFVITTIIMALLSLFNY